MGLGFEFCFLECLINVFPFCLVVFENFVGRGDIPGQVYVDV